MQSGDGVSERIAHKTGAAVGLRHDPAEAGANGGIVAKGRMTYLAAHGNAHGISQTAINL